MKGLRSLLRRLPNLSARNYLLLLILTPILFLLPYFAVQIPSGHDLPFHLNRIEGLAQAYQNGEAFPAIFYNLYRGTGYGTPLFYGNLAIVLPAALHALGLPLIASWKINILFVTILAAVSCFLCARVMIKNDYAAFVMSVVLVFSGYFATDLFFRASIGEMTSFIFLPVTFLGLYGILREPKIAWPLLPIGLSLILYCHLLSALITVFGLFVFALFHIKILIRNPKKLLLLLASVGLFLLFSAFYILPMGEQLASSSFLATNGSSATAYGTLRYSALPWWSLASDWNMILHVLFPDRITAWIPNGLGLSFPLMLAAAIYYGKKANYRRMLTALALCALTLLLCSKLFPWQAGALQETFGILQFPWRFLMLATFFLALFAGEFVSGAEKSHAGRIISVLFLGFSLLSFAVPEAQELAIGLNHTLKHDVIEYPYINNVGTGDYLPIGFDVYTIPHLQEGAVCDDPAVSVTDLGEADGVRTIAFSGGGSGGNTAVTVNLFFRKAVGASAVLPDGSAETLALTQTDSAARVEIGSLTEGEIQLVYVPTIAANRADLVASSNVSLGYGSVTAELSGAQNGDWIEVPLLWYKGYQAKFTAYDGSVSILPVSAGTLGMCRVSLNGVSAGTLTVRYARTPVQIAAMLISAASFTGAAVWGVVVIARVKKRNRTGAEASISE